MCELRLDSPNDDAYRSTHRRTMRAAAASATNRRPVSRRLAARRAKQRELLRGSGIAPAFVTGECREGSAGRLNHETVAAACPRRSKMPLLVVLVANYGISRRCSGIFRVLPVRACVRGRPCTRGLSRKKWRTDVPEGTQECFKDTRGYTWLVRASCRPPSTRTFSIEALRDGRAHQRSAASGRNDPVLYCHVVC